ADGESRLAQGRVGERLRVVPEVGSRVRVHLLAEEAEGAGPLNELVEELAGVGDLADPRQGLYEPEGTRQERTLLARKAIVAWRIAVQQRSSGAQPIANGVDGALDAR